MGKESEYAICCSNGGRGTFSEAVGAEMVGRRVQGHANALHVRTSHCFLGVIGRHMSESGLSEL